MKKLYSILFFILGITSLRAQEIDSIVFVPASPTNTDTVRAYVYLTFPSGSCADVGSFTMSGTDIYGYAFHCMGTISMVCNDIDTLVIPPLAVGNYTMYFTLDAGYGPPGNCTPGFQPYDVDTVSFSVTFSTAIVEHMENAFRVYPNPASDQLVVESQENNAVIQLINVLGEVILEEQLRNGSNYIQLGSITEGAYQCRVISKSGISDSQKIQIIR